MPTTSSKYILEIACFDAKSCLIAQQAGADRIEFCADYSAGGITPTQKDILEVREKLHVPLHVIVRPRKGNFVYSAKELNCMKNTILFCKENKIDGIVLGVLNPDNSIDQKTNKELIELAKPMFVTFHRAIDECTDIEKAFIEIIGLEFNKVLTSGGNQNALAGIEVLRKCQQQFGEKIIIIPGGGIRHNNVELIVKETQCKEFHSAAIVNDIINIQEIKKLKEFIK